MFNIRRFLAVVIVISVIALTVVIYRHLPQKDPKELLEMLPENIDLALEELHYTQNEDGRRRWTLDADTAEYLNGVNVAKLETVKLLFYDQGEFGDVHLSADRGKLLQDSQQVDLVGNVVVTTARGDRLLTDSLHYDDQQHRVTTDDPVQMESQQGTLTGVGLQIDVNLGRMIVKRDVHVVLYPTTTEKE